MSARDTVVSNETHVMLRGPADWSPWLKQIKLVADRIDHWKAIDPSAALNTQPPNHPAIPNDNIDFDDNAAIGRWEAELKRYRLRLEVRKLWQEKEDKIWAAIDKTIVKALREGITRSGSMANIIAELKRLVNGDSPFQTFEDERAWSRLLTGSRCRGTDLQTWITEVQTLHERMRDRSPLASDTSYRAHLEMIAALEEAGYQVSPSRKEVHGWIKTRELVVHHPFREYALDILNELRPLRQPNMNNRITNAAVTHQGLREDGTTVANTERQCQICKSVKHKSSKCGLARRAFNNLPLDRLPKEKQDAVKQWLTANQEKAKQWFTSKEKDSTGNPTTPTQSTATVNTTDSNTTMALDRNLVASICLDNKQTPQSSLAINDIDELGGSVIVDSGSSINVCNNRQRMEQLQQLETPVQIESGGRCILLSHKGIMKVFVRNADDKLELLRVTETFLFEEMHTSVISHTHLNKKGFWYDDKARMWLRNGQAVFRVTLLNGVFVADQNNFPYSPNSLAAAIRTGTQSPASLWHRRLIHAGPKMLEYAGRTQGLKIQGPTTVQCQECAQAKAKRREWVNSQPVRYSAPFAHTAWDLFEFGPAMGRSGHHFAIRLDRVTGMIIGGIPQGKDQTSLWREVFGFDLMLQRRYDLRLRAWQCDNETGLLGAWNSAAARTYFNEEQIELITTSPHTPHENPAERAGGVVIGYVRAIFIETGLPTNLWPWICDLAVHVLNRLPREDRGWISPLQLFNDWLKKNKPQLFGTIRAEAPSLAYLRVPGSRAYPLTSDALAHRNRIALKTSPRAHIGYLVGYKSSTQYYVWVPCLKRVINTPHVTFDESRVYKDDGPPSSLSVQQEEDMRTSIDQLLQEVEEEVEESAAKLSLFDLDDDPIFPHVGTGHIKEATLRCMQVKNKIDQDNHDKDLGDLSSKKGWTAVGADLDEANILTGKRTRKRKTLASVLTQTIEDETHTTDKTDDLPPEPRHHAELRYHPCGQQFLIAEEKELARLVLTTTYMEVPETQARADKKRPLDLKWVYKYKYDTDGRLTGYKARLCVRGDQQEDMGLSTYAATLAARTYRCLLAIANKFNLAILQYDAVSAFTNSPLDELIYTKFPPGRDGSPRGIRMIWKLRRALYGLRRSPLLWYRLLRSACEELGLIALKEDACVLTNGKITIFFHVDDINIMFHPRYEHDARKIEKGLTKQFELTGGKPIANFLKIAIARSLTERRIWLCQRDYIVSLERKFNLCAADFKSALTPLPPKELPQRDHTICMATKTDKREYLRKIGSILYPAIMTRPDVAFAAAMLAQFSVNPAPEHHMAANHVIGYMLQTQWLGLCFQGTENDLSAYADASFADDRIDRKSSQGYLMKLFGGPVLWKASKQLTVSTSSTEAEIIAASAGGRELIAITRLFDELDLNLEEGLNLFCDNMQTVRLLTAETATLSTRLRHVDIHRHWLRQEVQSGRFSVKWIPTEEMAADGLTKALNTASHKAFVSQLGLVNCERAFHSCTAAGTCPAGGVCRGGAGAPPNY